jgi:hypothetical protein
MVASMSRFSAMHKKASGPMTERDRANVERVAATYNMKAHGASSSDQARGLDPEFIASFALVGPAQGCVDRVGEIENLGIDRRVRFCQRCSEEPLLEIWDDVLDCPVRHVYRCVRAAKSAESVNRVYAALIPLGIPVVSPTKPE